MPELFVNEEGNKDVAAELAAPVSRDGGSVKLVEVRPEMMEFLFQLAVDEAMGWRWRFGGASPRRDTFEQSVWSGVLTQFIVLEKTNGGMIGNVVAYNAELNHGFAYVAAGMVGDAANSGVGVEAVDLFVGHLFACYRLRKLYFEVPEYNVPQFESAIGSLLKIEGILKEHTFYNGRYWDRYVLALYRKDYEQIGRYSRLLGRRRRPRIEE